MSPFAFSPKLHSYSIIEIAISIFGKAHFMSEVLEFAARLSTVVGARPAGTEEEQQASFFIEEAMTDIGLDTTVEEFNCNPNYEMPRIACCIASIVLAVLAIVLPLMVIPAFIVCTAAAVFYILEVLGSSPLTNATKGGVSQNVIAKYYPGMNSKPSIDALGDESDSEFSKIDGKNASGGHRHRGSSSDSRSHRKRKIVILARYDSGRVRLELKPPFMGILDKIHWVEIGGMVLVPIALLLRLVTGAAEDMHLVWDILVGVGAFCSLLPVIAYIIHQTAAYNEGANNNASGVAVMTEIAKKLVASSKPSLSSKVLPDADGLPFSLPSEVEDSTVIAAVPDLNSSSPVPIFHGKDAIVGSGVLPVDTDLIYDEAANGTLGKTSGEYIAEREEKEESEQVADATVAFVPVSTERSKDNSSSQPIRDGRQSALSLEAQMQSASLEFAKFDDSQSLEREEEEEEEKNPWIRLQNQASDRSKAAAQAASASPDVTADLLGAQTIAIPDANQADDPNVPDWFKKGMAAASANKPEEEERKSNVQRSRFADALDAAHEASAQAMTNFGGKDASQEGASGIDRTKLDELHAKIMGESAEGGSKRKGSDSAEAKAARRAKLMAARDARNASKEELANEELENEALAADQMAEDAETRATIEAKIAAQAAAQALAAEEVAEQAAVADRTISFIPVAADMPADVAAKSASETGSHEPIKKTAEEILDDAASLTGSRRAVSIDEDVETVGRRSISLPSLTVSKGKKSDVQDAPLAEDANRADGESRTALKNVGGETEYGTSSRVARQSVQEGISQSLEGATTSFLQESEADALAALSSLDSPSNKTASAQSAKVTSYASKQQSTIAAIPTAMPQSSEEKEAPITVSTAGSFVQPSQTSNFMPVGDELIANIENEEDIIIEDVDDSDYTENVTHTGAIAGPGYVEMPKSRMSRIKSFFGKKESKESDSISFADAVGIDADFDAREIGKARGGWESFKDNSSNFDNSAKPQSQNLQGSAGNPSGQAQMPPQGQRQMQPNQQMPMQGQRQVAPQMQGQRNPNQGIPQSMQQGAIRMPMQGQPMMQGQMPMQMQGQPMMPGQMPMQGQRQMQPNQQMPMQGMPQFQGQMPMQGQPMMQGQQGQQMTPQQFGGQMQQSPIQGGPTQQKGGPTTPLRQAPLNQGLSEHAEHAGQEEHSEHADHSEKAEKKSHRFSIFKRKNKDGDINSGAFDDADWNGGAFSLGRDKDPSDGSSRQSRRSSQGSSRSMRHSSRSQSTSGGRRRSADEVLAEEAMLDMTEDELMAQDMLDERDQIRNFRSSATQLTSFEEVAAFARSVGRKGDATEIDAEILSVEEEPDIGFQTEVWFVALGAELANNAGVKNLLAEHGEDLRGAVIIDIDALGAGELSVIEEEGLIRRVKSSTRMRRYASKAAKALGMKLGSGKILWRESAAYYTTKRGLLTMHLCGMMGGKPAYAGEIDDTFDKLSEETLLENTAFMLELINAI